MLQFIIHYSLHLLVPGLIAWIFFKDQWKKAWLIMLATMLVDVDHLFASPIYSPNRCSINFHILHSYYAIAVYLLLLYFKKFRIVAIGLLFHMLTDFIDCLFMK
jgi:phosphatidylglycerophosphate synthase